MLNEIEKQANRLQFLSRGPSHVLTEKTKSLLFLLREVPFIRLRDIQRFFFPTHKTFGYTFRMVRVLTKSRLVSRYMLGNGVFVYFITEDGHRIADFLMQDEVKFDLATKSFYFASPPRKSSEVSAYFHFPSRDLLFKTFTPHVFHMHPYLHTVALLELYYLLRKSRRIFHVVWLDLVHGKQESLSIPFHPDLLLTNSLTTEEGRLFVELENSVIGARNLVVKLDHLCSMPAEWYLFLCTKESIFQNLGRTIRKILQGEAKHQQKTLYVTPHTQAVLSRNLLIGLWKPSIQNGGVLQRLKDLELFRYDEPVFDKTVWMKAVDLNGKPILDAHGLKQLRRHHVIPYPTRKAGTRKYVLGEILDRYSDGFRKALEKVVEKSPAPRGPSSNKEPS